MKTPRQAKAVVVIMIQKKHMPAADALFYSPLQCTPTYMPMIVAEVVHKEGRPFEELHVLIGAHEDLLKGMLRWKESRVFI